jgi:2-methylfumaryl-CoA isomerase
MTEAGAQPLAGLRIVDLSTFVAGPSCSQALARLGAEVIRIDPIGGAADHSRLPLGPEGESLYWEGLNEGKLSIELDLSSARGRELVRRLVALPGPDAGILLTNAVRQPWLEYEAMRPHRDDLIMAHIRGFADGRPAVDYTVNCEVGLPSITGPPEWRGVTNHVLPAWDLLTGLHCALAILAAKRVRDHSGEGQLITISLADVALATMDQLGFIADAIRNGSRRKADGNHVFGAFGTDFDTADGERVMVTALTGPQWRKLVEATETGEAVRALEGALGVDFAEEAERFERRELLAALLRPWFAARPLASVAETLDACRVLWGRYRSIDQLVHDEDSLLNRGRGPAPAAAPAPFELSGSDLTPLRPAALGRETDAVLGRLLELEQGELAELQAERVIGTAAPLVSGREAA